MGVALFLQSKIPDHLQPLLPDYWRKISPENYNNPGSPDLEIFFVNNILKNYLFSNQEAVGSVGNPLVHLREYTRKACVFGRSVPDLELNFDIKLKGYETFFSCQFLSPQSLSRKISPQSKQGKTLESFHCHNSKLLCLPGSTTEKSIHNLSRKR